MGYPICHTVKDTENDRVVRLVVVPEKGKFTHMTNYGGFFSEDTQDDYDDEGMFDTENSAIGYLAVPSQGGTEYEVSFMEDVAEKTINELVERIKNGK